MTNPASEIKTIAIIGAGPGGFRLVANLGLAGYRLRLNDIDDAKLTAIRARGGIDVEGTPGGFAPLELATTDLGATVTGAGSELAAGIESMAGAAISAARNAGSAGTTPAAVDTIGVAGAGVQRLALRVAVAGIAC